MKIYIDLAKQAITNTTDEKVYEGDFYSNVFEVLFYNYENENWFPTMSQLAPNGREAGDFTADALGVGESHTYVEDGKTYLRFTFTMGATWVLMKGKSNFYIWMNRLNGTVLKKCVGMVNVMIDQSTDNYFIADVTFNPNVKAYIDSCIDEQNEVIAQLGNGEPKYFDTAANIALLEEDKGLAVATDTGHLYYWDVTEETATKYKNSGVQYTNLSAYYTKTQADALLANKADKSTAITHTGSQLQDYSGNDIYPNLADGQVTYKKINSALSNLMLEKVDYSSDVITNKVLLNYGAIGNGDATAVVTNYIPVKEGDLLEFSGAWYTSSRAGVVGYKSDGTLTVIVGNSNYPSNNCPTPSFFTIPSNVIMIRCASNNITDYPLTANIYTKIKNIEYETKDYSSYKVEYKLLLVDGNFNNSNEATAVTTGYIPVETDDIVEYNGAWYGIPTRAGMIGIKSDGSVIPLMSNSKFWRVEGTDSPIRLYVPDDVKFICCASNNITAYPLTVKVHSKKLSQYSKDKVMSGIKSIGIELNNPTVVITKSANEYKIESPNVFFDTNTSKFGMVYTSYVKDENDNAYGRIMLAWSNDLTSWTVEGNPILERSTISTDADYGSVTGPVIFIENGTYYLYYIGCDTVGYEQGNLSICLATGTDIHSLTKYASNPVIRKTNLVSWYNYAVYHANISKINDRYYLFVNGKGQAYYPNSNTAGESIGYAVSSDLIHWNVSPNAVLKYSLTNTDIDYSIVGDPYVFDIGDDNYYMAYFAYNHTNPQGAFDFLAKCKKSDFPFVWDKTNIKLTTTSFNCKPSIFIKGGTTYHFYGANGTNIGFYKE